MRRDPKAEREAITGMVKSTFTSTADLPGGDCRSGSPEVPFLMTVDGYETFRRALNQPDPAVLLDLIRQAEWASVNVDNDGMAGAACTWCHNLKTTGHAHTCPIKPLLYPEMT